jgi:hypothetical protein
MNIELIKELGSGGNGTVYLAKRGEEELVYKMERMDSYDEDKPLTSEYYRQIKFNKDIAIHHPDKFLTLRAHGIIFDCEYKHPKLDDLIKSLGKDKLKGLIRKNSQPNCYFLLYSPYLEGHFADVKDKVYNNPILLLDFLHQIVDSINIVRKKGYAQNDPYYGNMMFQKKGDRYQWYLIDYGFICHKNFPQSLFDEDIMGRTLHCMDLAMFVDIYHGISLKQFIRKHDIRAIPFNEFIDNLKKEPEYEKIVKLIPESAVNKKFYNKFSNIITKIRYPQTYLKCHNVDERLYKTYNEKDMFPELFIHCLQHYDDETYDGILAKIKEKQSISGGYCNKYEKYKNKYWQLKGGNIHKLDLEDIVFVCGKAGVGKSTVAKKISEDLDYVLISMDEVIRDEIVPLYKKEIEEVFDGDSGYMFSIYRGIADKEPTLITQARIKFIEIMKKKIRYISDSGKVVVEGSLWNHDAIRYIFGKKDDYSMVFVQPKSLEIYIDRLKRRFVEDPDNYGRFGPLFVADKDKVALIDFHKNGIDGQIISELIKKVGEKEFNRVEEWKNERYKGFDMIIHLN